MANAAGAYGALSISGGTATIGSWLAVGRNGGTGVLNMTGGSLTINSNNLTVGSNGNSALPVGSATLSGNSIVNVTNTGGGQGGVYVGESSSGILTLSGVAALTTSGPVGVELGRNNPAVGILNLDGGTLTTSSVSQGGGTGIVNFSGGILRASAASTSLMTGVTGYVYGGGGTIDNGGNNITITTALLAPTGDGVAAAGTTLTAAGTGYIAPPLVQITGGGGTGATAIANINSSGALTGVTITNPGIGYTSAPTFTLVGGGNGASGSVTGTAPLPANTSGQVTFQGSGTTTLGIAGSYSGGSLISSGTTVVAGGGALGTGVVNVAGGGTLRVSSVTGSAGSGLFASYYQFSGNGTFQNTLSSLANLQSFAYSTGATLSGTTTTLDFGTGGNGFPAQFNNNFIGYYTGKFTISTGGTYTFGLNSDDGSMLFIDGQTVVSNNNFQGVSGTFPQQSGTITLAPGQHTLVEGYYQGGGGYGLVTEYSGPDTNGSYVDISTAQASLGLTPEVDLTVGSLTGSGNVVLSSGNLVTGEDNTNQTFSGVISGAFGVTKTGMGTQTFNGQNTYSAGTTVSGGTLRAGASSVTTGSGATLAITSGPTGTGSLTLSGGTLDVAGNNLAVNGFTGTTSSIVGNSAALPGTLTIITTATPQTYSGTIQNVLGSGSSTTAVAIAGSGTETFTGPNTYSGGTNITSGTLIAGGHSLGAGTVTVASGGTLSVSYVTATAGAGLQAYYWNLASNAQQVTTYSSLTNLQTFAYGTVPNLSNTTTTLNFNTGGNGNGFPPGYAGNGGAFNAYYSGRLNITTGGSYTFNTTSDDGSMIWIDGVNVVANDAQQAPTPKSGSISLTAGQHTIVVGYFQGGGGLAMDAQWNGPDTGNSAVDLTTTSAPSLTPEFDLQVGSLSGSGNVQLSSGNLVLGADNTSQSFSGAVSGTYAVAKLGTGIQTFGGQSTYSGGTAVTAGTLRAGASSTTTGSGATLAITSGPTGTGNVMLAGGTLDVAGNNLAVNGLSGSTATVGNSAATVGTLTIVTSATPYTFAGDTPQTFSGTIQDRVNGGTSTTALVVGGSGTQTLSGVNTYSGATTVSGGTLRLSNNSTNNPIPNTPVITVGSGATLDVSGLASGGFTLGSSALQTLQGPASGTGTVNGNVVVSSIVNFSTPVGGTLAASSGATLQFNSNLTLQSGSALTFTLNTALQGNSTGLINVLGSLTVSDMPAVSLSNSSVLMAGDTYDVLSYTANMGISKSNFNLPSTFGSFNLQWSTLNNDELQLSVTGAGNGLQQTTAWSQTYASASPPVSTLQTGPPVTWTVDSGSTYAGIASSISGIDSNSPGTGAPMLTQAGSGNPLTASIVSGGNTGSFISGNGGNATASMSWRTRTTYETNGTSPPLPFAGHGGLISNVLSLSGMGNGTPAAGTGSVQTDPFALDMQYNPQTIPGLGSLSGTALANAALPYATNGAIYLGWLDPIAGAGGVPQWVNAVNGNFDLTSMTQTGVAAHGSHAAFGFQGSFAQFVFDLSQSDPTDFSGATASNLTSAQLDLILGSYGVDNPNYAGANDVGGYDAWAVVNHNSQFAVVPEPSSLLLAALGLAGVAGYKVRQRRNRLERAG